MTIIACLLWYIWPTWYIKISYSLVYLDKNLINIFLYVGSIHAHYDYDLIINCRARNSRSPQHHNFADDTITVRPACWKKMYKLNLISNHQGWFYMITLYSTEFINVYSKGKRNGQWTAHPKVTIILIKGM